MLRTERKRGSTQQVRDRLLQRSERARPSLHRTLRKQGRDEARPAGFEPATYGLGNRCSVLLSYGRLAIRVARIGMRRSYLNWPRSGTEPNQVADPLADLDDWEVASYGVFKLGRDLCDPVKAEAFGLTFQHARAVFDLG